jgi:hypothetical protein
MAIVITRLTWTLATENRLLRKAGTEPEVVAYLLPDQRHLQLLNLVVANVGRGPARNVELEFIGDDLDTLHKRGARLLARTKLPILSVLPQDERFVQLFGSYLELCNGDSAPPDFTIRVNFENSSGSSKTTASAKNSAISTGATVCFSRLELTLHGSPALCLAADVVVLPLHTRHLHRQHAMTCLQHYP